MRHALSNMKLKSLLFALALVSTSLHAQDWQAQQQAKNREHAAYWAERGYRFDSTYTTAWSMDNAVNQVKAQPPQAPRVTVSTTGPTYSTSPVSSSTSSRYTPPVVSSAASYGRYYDYGYRPSVGEHYVSPHIRSDGTFVQGHWQTDADSSFWNIWSSSGNLNPHTGSTGTKLPPYSSSYGGSGYVGGYTRSDGTYVAPHFRSR